MTASHADAARADAGDRRPTGDGARPRSRSCSTATTSTTRDAGPAGRRAAPGARTCRGRRVASSARPSRPSSRPMDAGALDLAGPRRRGRPRSVGMGICRQLKDEIFRCPPILVLTGRPQDGWLAAWSRADAPCRTRSTRSRSPRPSPTWRAAAGSTVGLSARGHDRSRRAEPTWPDLLTALLRRAGPDARRRPPGRWTRSWAARRRPVQIAGFLVALRAKGETVEEMRGLADAMLDARRPDRGARAERRHRRHRRRPGPHRQHLDDGRARRRRRPASGSSSTATGRRRRACGSADVLEELGRPARPHARRGWPRWPSEAGITFCFAQVFHPVVAARRASPGASSASATAFNFLGPLTNPAQPRAQAVGVRRRADGAADGRGVRRRGARGAGLPRRRRARRAHHRDDLARCGGCATARSPS